jgi:hypothetical protein
VAVGQLHAPNAYGSKHACPQSWRNLYVWCAAAAACSPPAVWRWQQHCSREASHTASSSSSQAAQQHPAPCWCLHTASAVRRWGCGPASLLKSTAVLCPGWSAQRCATTAPSTRTSTCALLRTLRAASLPAAAAGTLCVWRAAAGCPAATAGGLRRRCCECNAAVHACCALAGWR